MPRLAGVPKTAPAMLDLRHVSQNFDAVVQRLSARGGSLDLGPFKAYLARRPDAADKRDIEDEIYDLEH